jgi:CubicO group peptidase (beta-lactamase class C family)
MTPKEFANINLFPFLGINNPDWNAGYNDINDGASGLMLNLREMVKLGQLYLQDGYSGDNQIISSDWLNEATSLQVENSWNWNGDGGYGYLWWLPERGYLAWGLGGQYIVVIPELNLVIGTHSWVNDATSNYQVQLTGIIYNQIVPLFE